MGAATYIGGGNAIGGTGNDSEIGWNGAIGDVAFFNQALTGAQIATLFADAPKVIPEPTSVVLMCLSALGLLATMYRRRTDGLLPAGLNKSTVGSKFAWRVTVRVRQGGS